MNPREMLTHNLGLKMLSLLLAAILWLYVVSGKEAETGLSIPVVFANLPPGLVISSRLPSRLDVQVTGPRIMLLRLNAVLLPVHIDLKDAREGVMVFTGIESWVRVPDGVRVTRVAPAAIEVRLIKAGQ